MSTWTKDKPTQPGWYWYRSPRPTLVVVCYIEIGLRDNCVSFAYGERYQAMSEMEGEWAGPIPEPMEA